MNRVALLAALTVVIAGTNFSARAGSTEDEAFQKRLFGRALDAKKAHACFGRVYDAGHLAEHPQQNVRTMLLLVIGDSDAGNGPSYGLRLGVTFRKSGTHFESAGSCGAIHDATDAGGSAGVAHCGVDCDGGSINVAIKDEKSVLVSIPKGARIWRAGSTVEDTEVPRHSRQRFGADDKAFRLDKVALTQCLPLADDNKEKATMRREK
jgi:hypothetical protein